MKTFRVVKQSRSYFRHAAQSRRISDNIEKLGKVGNSLEFCQQSENFDLSKDIFILWQLLFFEIDILPSR